MEDIYKAGFVLGGLSLLIFALGHLGLITPPFLIVPALLAFAVLAAIFFKSKRPSTPEQSSSRTDLPLKVAIIILIISILPLALTPPTVRDELIQHLAVPKLYLLKGRIFELKALGFSYLPQNIDLLYLIPLGLGNDIVPRLTHFLFGVLTGLLIYFYLLKEAGRSYGLLGMLLYLSTPLILNLGRTAYIDHGAALYSMLSLVAALKWKDGGDKKWLIYSAVSMGLALGAKYNTLLSLVLINAFIVFVCLKKGKVGDAVKFGTLYLIISLLILSPWLVRNYIWTGSPLYPLYESVVSATAKGEGVHVTSEMAPLAKRLVLYNEGIIDLILLPFRVFWEGADNSIERFDGVLNPLFLAFIPIAFIKRKKRYADLKYLAVFSVLFFAMAALTVDLVTRYLLPIMPVLVIISVFGIRNMFESRFKWVSAILLMAAFVFNINYEAGLYRKYTPFTYLTGQESRDDYLGRMLPDYKAVSYANKNLPPESKVFFLFAGDRGYYWDREYSYGDRMGVFFKALMSASKDDADLTARISRLKITHIFMNDAIMERFSNENYDQSDLMTLAGFFNRHTVRLYSANGFSLYEIKQAALGNQSGARRNPALLRAVKAGLYKRTGTLPTIPAIYGRGIESHVGL
ncbi:MAG: glycosyltransferase family 39 protein [Deltaproteobacteria bacterium]|nr:glycosyltransferase family 39 protein [Deltaproteobacteria bacterium]